MCLGVVACLLIVSLVGGNLVSVPQDERFAPEDLANVVDSLDLILKFFARNSDQVNLDAVLGTRIVEGQMKVVWEKLLENRTSPELTTIADEVFKLYKKAKLVSDQGEASVRDQQPAYYRKLKQMIGPGFWELNYDSRNLEVYFYSPSNGSDGVKEIQSDNCLAELLGSPPNTPKCEISDFCWTMMTNKNYRGYSLTHEVIYLQIGELMGCWPEMSALSAFHQQPPPDELAAMFCSHVMDDAMSIEKGGFSNEQQDLFMEQIGICGMLGFREFAKKSWLDQILSWQRPVGCFGLYQNFIRNYKKYGFDVMKHSEGSNSEIENNLIRMRRYLPVPLWTRFKKELEEPEDLEELERLRRYLPVPMWTRFKKDIDEPEELERLRRYLPVPMWTRFRKNGDEPQDLERMERLTRHLPVPIWGRFGRSDDDLEDLEELERLRRFLPIPYWPKMMPSYQPKARGRRTKREEKRMSHNCLAHKTAVAGVALSAYVRFIIEDLMGVWLQ